MWLVVIHNTEKLQYIYVFKTIKINFKICPRTLSAPCIPACAVIAIRKRFSKDERYEGFHEANMPTAFRQEYINKALYFE